MKNVPFHTLQDRLRGPLPGQTAQFRMAHAIRQQVPPPPSSAKIASVLALFYPKNERWHLVLIERVSHNPNDRHGGQISFPGGRREPQDPDLAYTAIRETEEEVGVQGKDVELIGALTELYIPVSNFLVHPFVGRIDYRPNFRPQETEVAGILEIPFEEFTKPESLRYKDMTVGAGLKLSNVPYYHIQDRVVWGATAMMLSELLEVMPMDG